MGKLKSKVNLNVVLATAMGLAILAIIAMSLNSPKGECPQGLVSYEFGTEVAPGIEVVAVEASSLTGKEYVSVQTEAKRIKVRSYGSCLDPDDWAETPAPIGSEK